MALHTSSLVSAFCQFAVCALHQDASLGLVQIVLHHHLSFRQIGRLYRDAQGRLLWKDKTCPARTQLIMSWKALLLLLLYHLSDAAVGSEGKKQTVAELHRGSRMPPQAAKTGTQQMLMALAMLTRTMMRRQIQGKGCVSYAWKTEAAWCFKHVVICAHAISALLISTGVPSVEPGPEPSECIMLECSIPVLCDEVCGVDMLSQVAVCVLCLRLFLLL